MIDDFFDYNENDGLITYKYENDSYKISTSNVKSAVVNTDKRIILIVTENSEKEILNGYTIFGKHLFSRILPEHYGFWYLSPNDLRIACIEKDELAEKSGRSGWWFQINITNGEMTKDCWAY